MTLILTCVLCMLLMAALFAKATGNARLLELVIDVYMIPLGMVTLVVCIAISPAIRIAKLLKSPH